MTAYHGKHLSEDVSIYEALFLDCDMAILGASKQRYNEYAIGVRYEHTSVMLAEKYTLGRIDFLKTLLKAKSIFLSDYFNSKLEARARKNITKELECLKGLCNGSKSV